MKKYLVLLAIAAISISGCATNVPGSHIIGPGKTKRKIDPKQLQQTTDAVYHLATRDVLLIQLNELIVSGDVQKIDRGNQIRVAFTQNQNNFYKIVAGDQLSLEFPDESDAIFTVLVSPDGYVTLPKLSKTLKVTGMTLSQLTKTSLSQYKNLFLAPNLSWALTRTFNDQLPRMSGDFSVGTDGAIVVPELGEVSVLGKSAKEVADVLTSKVQERFNNQVRASVSVTRVNAREQVDTRLTPSGLLMYSNLSNLPSRISDDGDVYIPHIGSIKAEGKTVLELKQEILSLAQPLYQNPIVVNVSIQDYADYNVFIGGEVKIPGRYTYSKKLSLLKLIAQAGWGNEFADMGNVLLVRADQNDNYTIYRTNLEEIFDGGGSSDQDFRLTPQDLVIVPPTNIAKTNRMITQYVRGILPFNPSVSYNINTSPSQITR
jgi:protein involved in polysaccharide export with SLBB domain